MPPGMNRAPPRSGRTSLTDAQLYLFDALFDVAQRLGALRREEFAALNLPYTHDLDPVELDAVVRQLAAAGLLRLRKAMGRPDLGPWIHLTAAGGRLWELEREPQWPRFCTDSSRPEGPRGNWILRIRASDAGIASAFLETARACGLYRPELSRLSRRQVTASVVPWKPPEPLVELRVPLLPAEAASRVADWARYDDGRTWWRSIVELATLAA
jgi:hypothetical protein